MKFSTRFGVVGWFGASAVLLAACASTQPPRELVDARAAVLRAQSGPASQLKPDAVHEAKNALHAAEQAFAAAAEEENVRTLAYVAERKADLATVEAMDVANATETEAAENQIKQISEQQLTHAQSQLGTSEEQRMEAEARAREALDRLIVNIRGTIREEARGMVVTLPGEVLFVVGKSTLLPSAQTKLDEVAKVLVAEPDRKVIVEGHTDSTGSEALNDRLSQQRAEAVRDYLVSKGVSRERVEAKGYGEAKPVSSNDTPAGRAMNRRVEIVIATTGS